MRRLFLLLAAVLFVAQLSAQKWVDTMPQNKNVVLEEFTGIHCGYCPDGHKRAADLAKQNPGRVVLVNIHAGGYATPQTGEPDLRTDAGTDIKNAAGVTGYPSGSVNRMNSPWGQSRSTWASDATSVLAESSPVNMAVKATVDHTTRELVVEVEAYYTANSPEATNYLSVMLLQNEILGPQSDYGDFNPDNWTASGDYRHQHALRMMLTPTFGETIDTTTKGHYVYKKYTTTLPDDIEDVDLVFHKLEIAAFIHETKEDIYTGVSTDVEFDPTIKTDLALTNMTSMPFDYCFEKINPKVEVTNNLDQVVTSFDVSVVLNGTTHTESFSGSLAKGQKTTIDWGDISFSGTGSYSINFEGFENVNGGTLFDMDLSNNFFAETGLGFTSNAFSTVLGGFDGTLPMHFAIDNSLNRAVRITYSSSAYYGANNTRGSVLFYLHNSWNVAGQPGDIIFGEANLSLLSDPLLSFYFAYSDGSLGGTAPTIKVQVSTDCGATWNEVRSITPAETGQPTDPSKLYRPLPSEWAWVGVPLTDYKDESVLLKITGIPGTSGNAMYVDQVQLAEATSTKEVANEDVFMNMYPNPASNHVQLEYAVKEDATVNYEIYNTLNQLVLSSELGNKKPGVHNTTIDVSDLSSGMYIMTIKAGDQVTTQKFVVKK